MEESCLWCLFFSAWSKLHGFPTPTFHVLRATNSGRCPKSWKIYMLNMTILLISFVLFVFSKLNSAHKAAQVVWIINFLPPTPERARYSFSVFDLLKCLPQKPKYLFWELKTNTLTASLFLRFPLREAAEKLMVQFVEGDIFLLFSKVCYTKVWKFVCRWWRWSRACFLLIVFALTLYRLSFCSKFVSNFFLLCWLSVFF